MPEKKYEPSTVEYLHKTILGHAKTRRVMETPVFEYTEMALL